MRKRILLSGYYGFANAGDEAVCAAVLQVLHTHGGDPEVTVLSQNPSETSRIHKVAAVQRNKILDVLPNVDALIQGGGSLLQDATSASSVFYYLWVIVAARIIRRPVFLYAQGIGPLRRPAVRAAVRTVLNRTQGISVRDRGSKALLAEIGVNRPSIYLTADPVWALEPAPEERSERIWELQGMPVGERSVTLALRAWPAVPNMADLAARTATLLQERGFSPAFLPMHRPADEELAARAIALMPKPAPCLKGTYDPADMMALAGRAGILAGMRLHALIFAAAHSLPVVGIPYDPKVSSLLEEIGAPATPGPAQMTPDAIVEAVQSAWEQRVALGRKMGREAERLRDNALSTARLVRAFLDVA
ncbi:MAG TPA: polysaccharide pyruvyl transferase CsaB [Armatimonadota bacterium]|jgi:polysaccharide pyruvyl transferase CsaB